MSEWDTTELLASIRARAFLTGTAADGTDDTTLLRLATEEIRARLGPQIRKANEAHAVLHKDYSITAAQANYRLPPRAVGQTLERVEHINSAGTKSTLTLVTPAEAHSTQTAGTPSRYYIEGSNLVLVPAPAASTGTIRMHFVLRQSRLVASGVSTAASVNTATKQVTLTSASGYASGSFDFQKNDASPDVFAIDRAATLSGSVLTFTDDLPADLAVGDYIPAAGTSTAPWIPLDCLPLVAQRVAVKTLEALGDNENLPAAIRQLEQMEGQLFDIINPRVKGEARIMADNSIIDALGW